MVVDPIVGTTVNFVVVFSIIVFVVDIIGVVVVVNVVCMTKYETL